MNHLLRNLAPISAAGWDLIDEEARQQLRVVLAGRHLVDFSGPHGWDHSAVNVGRVSALPASPGSGVKAAARRVLPLLELRAEFSLPRTELADLDRGAGDVDLGALNEAVGRIAQAENVAVFHGFSEAGIQGIAEASPHPLVSLGDDYAAYPSQIGRAVELLRSQGIGGPYGLALGPEGYAGVVETTELGGYPVFDHLRRILGGPIVWAPGVTGAVVLTLRGGDFLFDSGQDLSIGYDSHDAGQVNLYFEESFAFRVATPEAAVALGA